MHQALVAFGGEADEPTIQKRVQENRARLTYNWPREVRAALLRHSDGRGRCYFESVAGRPGLWRLGNYLDRDKIALITVPNHNHVPRLGRLIIKAMGDTTNSRFTAIEQCLLGIISYRLGWHTEAIVLLDKALANRLVDEWRSEAEQLRGICAMKVESHQSHIGGEP